MALTIDNTIAHVAPGTSGVASITTASFTPSVGDWLFALSSADNTNTVAITFSDSLSGTWTQQVRSDGNADAPTGSMIATVMATRQISSASSMTVTATSSGAFFIDLKVFRVSASAGIISLGASGHGGSASSNMTATAYTSLVPNSTLIAGAASLLSTATPTSSDLTGSLFYAGAIDDFSTVQGYKTLSATGSQTFNAANTFSGTASWHWVAIEVFERFPPPVNITRRRVIPNLRRITKRSVSFVSTSTIGNVSNTSTATATVTATVQNPMVPVYSARRRLPIAIRTKHVRGSYVIIPVFVPNVTSTITANNTVSAFATTPVDVTSTITAQSTATPVIITLGAGAVITATSSITTSVTYPTTDGIAAYTANGFLNVLRNVTFTGITTVYAQLHTGTPGPSGTANVSAIGTRKAITWLSPSSGVMVLNTLAIYTMNATELLTDISLWDASTSGNYLWSAQITPRVPVVNGTNLWFTTFTVSILTIAS